MHLLLTRPEADAEATRQRLEAAGHTVTLEPMLTIEPIATGGLELTGVQALVVTSRNALRMLARLPELAEARRLPLLTVGPGTAAEARALGFERIEAGAAGARELAVLVTARFEPGAGALLHLAGETLAFDLAAALTAAGYEMRTAALYRAVTRTSLAPATAHLLRQGAIDGVLLMSPRTATIYQSLIRKGDLLSAAGNVVHLCLSQAVAAALTPLGSVQCAVAAAPNLEEMLALIASVAAQSGLRS